jgi:hypothetical protein
MSRIYTAEDLDIDWDDEPEIIWCPMCLKTGYSVQLGPKILMNNEPRPEDYDQWLECGTCGWLCPIYSLEKEAEIKDSIETVNSPTDDKLTLKSAHKRRKPTRKVNRHIKKNIRQTNDPDIDLAIKQVVEDNVKVHYDSNP